MRHADKPRTEVKTDGTEVFIADYQDANGRHQIECSTELDARLMKEEFDLRSNPTISLAGYLLHYRHYMPTMQSADLQKNDRGALWTIASLVPNVRLDEVTSETIHAIRIILSRKPDGQVRRAPETVKADIYALRRAFDKAVVDGRVAFNPVLAYLAKPDVSLACVAPPADVPRQVKFAKITPSLSPVGARAFEMVAKAGLSYPEAICTRPEFINPEAGSLVVGLRWKADNTVGLPKNLPGRTVRGLDKSWLEWLLAAPRFPGDDGYLLQTIGRSGRPIGRRTMRERVVTEIAAAQYAAGMVSLETGKPYPGRALKLAHVAENLTLYPNQVLTVQAMAGFSSVDHFAKRMSPYIDDDEDSHEQMEGTLRTVAKLGTLTPGKDELKKILDAWERLGEPA